jgi:hypothetical protein
MNESNSKLAAPTISSSMAGCDRNAAALLVVALPP